MGKSPNLRRSESRSERLSDWMGADVVGEALRLRRDSPRVVLGLSYGESLCVMNIIKMETPPAQRPVSVGSSPASIGSNLLRYQYLRPQIATSELVKHTLALPRFLWCRELAVPTASRSLSSFESTSSCKFDSTFSPHLHFDQTGFFPTRGDGRELLRRQSSYRASVCVPELHLVGSAVVY